MLSTQNIGEKCRIPFNVISNLHCIDVSSDVWCANANTHSTSFSIFLGTMPFDGPKLLTHCCIKCISVLSVIPDFDSSPMYVPHEQTMCGCNVALSLCLSLLFSHFWHFHAIHARLRSVRLNSKQSTSFSLNNCGKCAHHVQLLVVCVWRIYAWHCLAINHFIRKLHCNFLNKIIYLNIVFSNELFYSEMI